METHDAVTNACASFQHIPHMQNLWRNKVRGCRDGQFVTAWGTAQSTALWQLDRLCCTIRRQWADLHAADAVQQLGHSIPGALHLRRQQRVLLPQPAAPRPAPPPLPPAVA